MLTIAVTDEKWDITYDTLEKLQKGEATFFEQPTSPGSYNMPEDYGRQMAADFGVMAAKGLIDVSLVGVRNGDFPEVKPLTVEELIILAWGKKD